MDALVQSWLAEEACAHIHGWDFSHIEGRYREEDDLPWDYRSLIGRYLRPEHRLLDIDTGGGEFLLSLGHPHALTSVTEGYPPNAALCQRMLAPLGIDVREANAAEHLPFADGSFDIVINRHGDVAPRELFRVLMPGGVFITQQVGAENDRELVDLLLPGTSLPFPQQTLKSASEALQNTGFDVLEGDEAFRPIRFFDVGALVWFARIIEWEFPGFSVQRCLPQLMDAQRLVEANGFVEGRIHRYFLIAQKS